MTTPAIQYTERRGKYNLYADPKLEKLIEENVTIGNWGKFDKAVAKLARHRKSVDGGRMRDHQRVIARQLIKVLKSERKYFTGHSTTGIRSGLVYTEMGMSEVPILCANYGKNL